MVTTVADGFYKADVDSSRVSEGPLGGEPSEATLASGGFVRAYVNGSGIGAATFDRSGSLLKTIATGGGAFNTQPHVGALSNGGFVVTWTLPASSDVNSDIRGAGVRRAGQRRLGHLRRRPDDARQSIAKFGGR